MFQRLEPWSGLEVCDLFAGIGALGIEALSRGAASVDFVDNDQLAGKLIKRNLTKAGVEDQARVIRADALQYLAQCHSFYDVILADPPYADYEWSDILELAAPLLKDEGRFVMELPNYSQVPANIDTRKYGKSKVCLWTRTN